MNESCTCFESYREGLTKRLLEFRGWLVEQIESRDSFIDDFATTGVDGAPGGFSKEEKKLFKKEKKLHADTLRRFNLTFAVLFKAHKEKGNSNVQKS